MHWLASWFGLVVHRLTKKESLQLKVVCLEDEEFGVVFSYASHCDVVSGGGRGGEDVVGKFVGPASWLYGLDVSGICGVKNISQAETLQVDVVEVRRLLPDTSESECDCGSDLYRTRTGVRLAIIHQKIAIFVDLGKHYWVGNEIIYLVHLLCMGHY